MSCQKEKEDRVIGPLSDSSIAGYCFCKRFLFLVNSKLEEIYLNTNTFVIITPRFSSVSDNRNNRKFPGTSVVDLTGLIYF